MSSIPPGQGSVEATGGATTGVASVAKGAEVNEGAGPGATQATTTTETTADTGTQPERPGTPVTSENRQDPKQAEARKVAQQLEEALPNVIQGKMSIEKALKVLDNPNSPPASEQPDSQAGTTETNTESPNRPAPPEPDTGPDTHTNQGEPAGEQDVEQKPEAKPDGVEDEAETDDPEADNTEAGDTENGTKADGAEENELNLENLKEKASKKDMLKPYAFVGAALALFAIMKFFNKITLEDQRR